MESASILGISLGTRQCGIVVLHNGTLVDWKVKNFNGIWSENKLQRIVSAIEKYIVRNGIQHVCCKIPTHLRTMRIDSLLDGIRQLTEEKSINFCVTTILELKGAETTFVENKVAYAELLTSTYMELLPILTKHRKVKTEYYLRIFEAVGAARHCLNNAKI